VTITDPLAQLGVLDVAAISDALDRLGIAGQVPGIHPLDRGFRTCGPAVTLRYAPRDGAGGTVGEYIDDVPIGSVIVIDNQGRTDMTVWGDILTTVAARNRLAGTVIDGVCRDVSAALSLSYPIFSRGAWMRTGKDRVRLDGFGDRVELAGVGVDPGDVVIGDADGIVVVPAARAGEVCDAAQQIAAAEQKILSAIADGARLADARAEHGYHRLQSRERA
jgi:4-hydroxy-4-methyl-2-oxoglutarate aldolase